MEKYILITAVVIMIIILALDFILSKYFLRMAINVIHVRNVFIKRIWKLRDGISKNGSVQIVNTNYTYDEED